MTVPRDPMTLDGRVNPIQTDDKIGQDNIVVNVGLVDAPTLQRVFWAGFEGLVVIAPIRGGGLVALQAMAVSTGLPFTIVLPGATVSLIKGLASERCGA